MFLISGNTLTSFENNLELKSSNFGSFMISEGYSLQVRFPTSSDLLKKSIFFAQKIIVKKQKIKINANLTIF